jgi:hypothetical protein
VRTISWLVLVLLAVGWLASEIPDAEPASNGPHDSGWRRTSLGWEHVSQWTPSAPPRRPALHPAVVGLLQLLLAAMALVAFSEDTPQR